MKYLITFLGVLFLVGCEANHSNTVAVSELEAAYECTDWVATGFILEGTEASRALELAIEACRKYYDTYSLAAYNAADIEDSRNNINEARQIIRKRAEDKFIEVFGPAYFDDEVKYK